MSRFSLISFSHLLNIFQRSKPFHLSPLFMAEVHKILPAKRTVNSLGSDRLDIFCSPLKLCCIIFFFKKKLLSPGLPWTLTTQLELSSSWDKCINKVLFPLPLRYSFNPICVFFKKKISHLRWNYMIYI